MTRDEVLAHAWSFGAGGMVPDELAYLYDACRDKDVLELGSMIGQSSYVIANVAKSLTCVDAWQDGCPFLEPRQSCEYRIGGMEAVFDRNMRGQRFVKIKAFTHQISRLLGAQRFDVILIDADHSYRAVAMDIKRSLLRLRPGGLLLLHDYRSHAWPGVRRAARQMLGIRPECVIHALGVFRP